MGFSYLDGKRWAQVTREERFFCQHLFNLLKKDSGKGLLAHINKEAGTSFRLDTEWEPAFEVCLYRDLNHLRKNWNHGYSKKRTFDLCMFSEEAIVILEAKAQQPFEISQVKNFAKDRSNVLKLTGVKTVWLGGLASSFYEENERVTNNLDGPLLTWKALADVYDNDEILARANELYNPDDLRMYERHNDGGKKTGSELIDLYEKGKVLLVGRKGGLLGSKFREDIQSGSWKTYKYETSHRNTPPNGNWFLLQEFAKEVNKHRRQ